MKNVVEGAIVGFLFVAGRRWLALWHSCHGGSSGRTLVSLYSSGSPSSNENVPSYLDSTCLNWAERMVLSIKMLQSRVLSKRR